jgi:hypothetical protein
VGARYIGQGPEAVVQLDHTSAAFSVQLEKKQNKLPLAAREEGRVTSRGRCVVIDKSSVCTHSPLHHQQSWKVRG